MHVQLHMLCNNYQPHLSWVATGYKQAFARNITLQHVL